MLGAMYIGLSGMSAYSTGLRQVSNNITNLNSDGYKATSVSFNDLFGNTSGGISYTDGVTGSGVQLSNPTLDLSGGDIRQTSNALDLAVDGNGFLVVEKNGEYFYARTGNFTVDEDGFVMLAGTDYKLTALNENGELSAVSLDGYRTDAPEETSKITFSGTLSTNTNGDNVIEDSKHIISDITILDSVGNSEVWELTFTPRPGSGEDQWTVIATNEEGEEIDRGVIQFEDNAIVAERSKSTFTNSETGQSVVLDFSENVDSFSRSLGSNLSVESVDGFLIGEIVSIAADENGALAVQYSNEQTESLGTLAIADFRQTQNLEQLGDGLFKYNSATGRELFTSKDSRVGLVRSNRIEASNVDLSQQFGDLILVQRGYQASSQVVSVSNDMIQQLFGLRGQG